MLRKNKSLLSDPRKKWDGEPLRQSWHWLPSRSKSLSTPTDERCLYEAQISVAVTGINHWVWTAYGLIDTYFGSAELVEQYHRWGAIGRPRVRADPLARGRFHAEWTAIEYFFRVIEIRMNQDRDEWNNIAGQVPDDVKWYV